MRILVANLGSTSFKYQLFETASGRVLAKGRVERIGQPGAGCPDYGTAIRQCVESLAGGSDKPLATLEDLDGVGFKAVHAGPEGGLGRVNEKILAAMERYCFLAPAHNPPYLQAMRAFRESIPEVPLVALFETAFFRLPEPARTYAVPYDWKTDLGVQRYGFHGAGHRYAAERAQALLQRRDLRHVSCHLGGSSSLAAIRNGVGVDSSFGMSPQSGLAHNNRVGDIDVFAVLHVMKQRGLGVDEVADILTTRSGLAGISGIGGDLRDLEASSSQRARLAVEVLVHGIRHYLGAFMLELGGLDVLSFSGGIGENSHAIRRTVCADLAEFGIELNQEANQSGSGERDISAGGKVRILVIPADEEWIVARYTAEFLEKERRTKN